MLRASAADALGEWPEEHLYADDHVVLRAALRHLATQWRTRCCALPLPTRWGSGRRSTCTLTTTSCSGRLCGTWPPNGGPDAARFRCRRAGGVAGGAPVR